MPAQLARADRFAIRLNMTYRESDDASWKHGQTENVSASGVLFESDQAESLANGAPLEMQLELPAEVVSPSATRILCFGRVVRTVRTPVKVGVGATIANFHFINDPDARPHPPAPRDGGEAS